MKKIFKEKNNLIILLISIIAIIIGSISFSFLWSFLIIFTIDLLIFLPILLQKKKSKRKKKSSKGLILKSILSFCLTMFIIGMIGTFAFFFIVVKKAPTFKPENLYKKEASILYDSKGATIAKIGSEIREKISFNEMSETLIDAIIATEDARFFQHNGFDLPRFLKASFGQALKQDAGGASTITMQLSKNHFTSQEASGIKGIIRKFTDIYFSIFQIEKKYTKFEIFEFYANSSNFGGRLYGGAYGVEQASQIYFNKKAKEISLPEAAMIAGLLQAPNMYDPYINPDKAETRRKEVLYLMHRHGYITKEEKQKAESVHIEDLLVEPITKNSEFQAFINTVVNDVLETTGLDPYRTSMEIYTTMDTDKQKHVNDVLSGKEFKWENDNVDGALTVIDVKTGAIVAIGSGRNHKGEKIWNLATDMKNHIGSTAKPLYNYGPGIEYNNWSSYQPFLDEPHGYTNGPNIRNWDSNYKGIVTLRDALIHSVNVAALKAFQSVDNKKILNFVKSIGLNPEIENGKIHEAHSLGAYTGESPLSLAAAYTPFANGGYYMKPYTYTKIKLRDNNKIIENKVKKNRVMKNTTAYIMTSVLIDTAPSAVKINGVTVAAKTGTSNFPNEVFKKHNLPSNAVNDLWMAGYNPEYTIAVWYGYDKVSSTTYNKFGSLEPRKLFQAVAKGVFSPNVNFTKPNNIIEIEIEKETYPAMLASPHTPKNLITKELFIKGLEPTEVSPRFDTLKDPTNLKAEQTNNIIKLSWDPIKTPNSIDENEINKFYNKLFKDKNTKNKLINARLNYNKKNIGEIGYNVYLKENEKLTLLGFTKNNYFEHTYNNSHATYIIKSVYSIFKNNESKGIETTIELNNETSFITSNLIEDSTIEININEPLNLEQNIEVLENTENVTHLANINISFKNNDNEEIETIDTSIEGMYTIIYKVSYKDYLKEHIRKVIIKPLD